MLEFNILFIPLAFFASDASGCAEGEAARLWEAVGAAPCQPAISYEMIFKKVDLDKPAFLRAATFAAPETFLELLA